MKKLITVFIILALGGGGVYYYYAYGKTVEKPQIIQAAISRGDVTQAVTATGTLEALRTVPVGSQVSGTVSELNADFNYIVHKGDVLAQIDPTLLNVQVSVQEANIARQQVDIDSQKIQLEDAQHNLVRTQQMFDKSLVTQQTLEQADLTVKTRAASIASAEKSLVQARANLDQAKLNVEYCKIISPIDGVVITRNVDKGQTVQASMSSPQFFLLATDLTHMKLTGGVDEADIGYIRPNQNVTFTVDSYPGQTFTGTVNSVRLNSQNQQNVVTYQVVIDVLNPELKLRPGMTASLKIIIETAPGVVRVPTQALRFRPNNDIYVALGLTPPAAGQRGGAAMAGAGATAPGATPPAAGAAPADAKGAAATPGQGRPGGDQTQGQQGQGRSGQNRNRQQQGQQGAGAGRGFGAQGSGSGNLTPEQMQQMAQRFGASGRGGGRGNRGSANQVTGPITPITERSATATKVDELFAELQRPVTQANVWIWDEKAKTLTQQRLTLGVSDGQFSELLSGDLAVGAQVVTSVILPVVKPGATGSNPLMQQNRGGPGGFGGPQPGGGGRGGGGGGRGGI